mgnify:CR=1 FL=1
MSEKAGLLTLVVINIKLSKAVNVEFKITEDPACAQPLNFYDIQSQLKD